VQPDQSIASRLLRAVIAKSFLEVLLVCVVATLAAFSTFSPQLRGAIDVADRTRVAGWVHDPRSPDDALEVLLFIDGKFVATARASERRDDLVKAGVTATPNHGFSFLLESLHLTNGDRLVQVYAVRNTSGASRILLPISKTPRAIKVDRH
jgi:hypothetical protein